MPNEDNNQGLPSSIEEAFARVRAGDTVSTTEPMGTDSMGESTRTEGLEDIASQGQAQSQAGTENISSIEGHTEINSSAGGPTIDDQGTEGSIDVEDDDTATYDYDEIGMSFVRSAQQMAVQAANELFNKQGITKASINDLYQRDDDGRVSFDNPDDPNHPFQNRAEAQQWVDAFNSQIDNEWRNAVREYQQQYAKDIQPVLRTVSFAPEYDAMSENEKKVFDNIVKEYELTDNAGTVIGYSCDLPSAKRMAMNIVNSMGIADNAGAQETTPAPAQGTGPAVDAKTSGTGNPQNDIKEPKNIAEAMKILADNKKKEKNNG